jgi:Cdc6-like AAA superfamily ATPase
MKHGKLQHWDVVHHFDLDYFQGQITKYVMRWKDKNGLQDLRKAQHFLDKYIELAEQTNESGSEPGLGYVNQDR